MAETGKKRSADIDHGYAWVILATTACMRYINAMLWVSYSILLVEIRETFQTTQSLAGWAGSLLTTTSSFSGFMMGSLTQRYGARPVCMIFSAIGSVGLFLSGFAPNIYYLCVTYGLMVGLMHGSTTLNTVVMLQRYFDKKRTLITGLVLMADSLGGFTTVPIYTFLISQLGWRTVISLHACLTLQHVVLAATFRPPPTPEVKATDEDQKNNESKKDPPQRIESSKFQKVSKVLGLELFRNKYFVGYLCAHVMLLYSIVCMYQQNPSRAINNGMDKIYASFLPSCIGMCSIISRPISSCMGNMKCTNRAFQVAGYVIASGIVVCLSCLGKTFVAAAIFAGAYGFSIGGHASIRPSLMVDWVGVQYVALAQGWVHTMGGLVSLSALPFTGWLFDVSGDFNASFIMAGTLTIISGCIYLVLGTAAKCAESAKKSPPVVEVTELDLHRKRLDSEMTGSMTDIPG